MFKFYFLLFIIVSSSGSMIEHKSKKDILNTSDQRTNISFHYSQAYKRITHKNGIYGKLYFLPICN